MATTTKNDNYDEVKMFGAGAGVLLLALAVLAALVMGLMWGFKAFNRTQRVADASTTATVARIKADADVTVMTVRIRQQEQKIQVATQEAQIRAVEAEGLRKAQETQGASLNPLYVQLRQVEALEAIAKDGKNSTVVYIPAGSGGIPLVAGAAGQPQVTAPAAGTAR